MSEDYSQVGIKADAGAGASPRGEESETQNVLTGDGTELCEVELQQVGDDGEIKLEESAMEVGGSSSIASASFNYINSIVGAGIIGLPFAVKEAGIGLGLILLCFCGYLTHYSTRLLVNTAKKVNVYNYEELVFTCFGKAGYNAVCFFMISFAFGALCAYLVIVGDTVTKVMEQWGGAGTLLANREFVIISSAVCVMLPLSLLRDMSALSKTSAVSIAADVLIILIILYKSIAGFEPMVEEVDAACADVAHHEPEAKWAFSHSAFMEAFGAMSFAYVCHHSSFLVYTSLENPTPERWLTVTHISIGFAIVASLTLSISGYASFGTETKANILSNYAIEDTGINIARLCLALTMFFTFPMEFFVVRHATFAIATPGKPVSAFMHIFVSLIWFSFILMVGVAVTNLGLILELTGGFSATFLAFILPAACYLRLEPGKIFRAETLKHMEKMKAIGLFIFGVVAMFTSTSLTLMKAFTAGGCE